ncbi:MAG: 50S ribosomal protein L31, large subunit ribosomal protein L31 [Candidatus Peregrinibacteria bacterium GW2011_GWC2_39_14]|nr:MAG: 50S ribosomal protein L31, large subunit ribosomal protein L31 [Candidatus Peregrinibacteria bacterium GW2011_GWC2_39_14]
MKKETHPKYYKDIQITCSCGAVYIAGSTKETLKTELCSACHPFYTGQSKLIDAAGRVDRFNARRQAKTTLNQKLEEEKKEKKGKLIEERLEHLVEEKKTTAVKTAKAKTKKTTTKKA